MFSLRNASLTVPIAAVVALFCAADLANARDGSRGGRLGSRLGVVPTAASHHTHGPATGALTGSATPIGAMTAKGPSAPTAAGKPSPAALQAINSSSTLPTPPAPPPAPPMPALAAPAGKLPPLAPLSAPVTTTTLTTGGAARVSSSAPSSTSPTEAAPSIAGGGGSTLEDCMRFWDRATHMSKTEWRDACVRSLHRLDEVVRDLAPAKPQ
jgi:hypothetical protein